MTVRRKNKWEKNTWLFNNKTRKTKKKHNGRTNRDNYYKSTDFDTVGGLNPIQIEIEDDRIINTLKKYKNVIYKITPPGIFFPETITNDTNLIFITAKELNGVKKIILSNKAYKLLAIIDLNKINNWSEVKGQLV